MKNDISAAISAAQQRAASLIRAMATITNRKCDRNWTPLFDAGT